MEFNKVEVAQIQAAGSSVLEETIRELAELQLAIVGGGIGDAIGL